MSKDEQAIISMDEYKRLKRNSELWENSEAKRLSTEQDLEEFNLWKFDRYRYRQLLDIKERHIEYLEVQKFELNRELNPLYTDLSTLLRRYNYKLYNFLGIKFLKKLR